MKKLILCCCMASLGWVAASAQSFTIKASLRGLADGTKVVIYQGGMHEETKPLDVQPVTGGAATFTIQADEPRLYILLVEGTSGSIRFMADKDNQISVSADAVIKKADRYDYCVYTNEVIEGSPLQKLYKEKSPDRSRFDKMNAAISEKYAELSKKIGEARAAKNTALCNELENSPEGKANAAETRAFFAEVERVFTKAITDNKDTFWGPLIMMDQYSYLTGEQAPIFNQFSDAAKNSFYGKLAKKEIFPPSNKGTLMPDFTATNWDTKAKTTFRALCKDKKVVLLDFWASWCNPCRKEIPNFKKLYAQYKDKGFEVVSISADAKDADWKKALAEEKLAWPNYRDADKSIQQLYHVKFYPTIYVLDAEGKCIAENVRGEALAKLLEELFK